MKRALAFSLAAVLALACRDHSPLAPPSAPQMAISDGAHSVGNPDFFFLPPMVPDPSGDPNFEGGEFNPGVSPVVQICEGTGATGPNGTECAGLEVAEFTMTSGPGSETVRLSLADEHYIVNWHTDQFTLDPALTYRIRVLVGAEVLGFADVELAANRTELRNVNTNTFVPLLDGRTLPIKFRIEDAALCDPPGSPTCSTGSVDLATGGFVVFEPTGDRIDIPPQNNPTGTVTLTLEQCAGLDIDLPQFGTCLQVTSDQPERQYDPRATVSICSAPAFAGLSNRQDDDLLTMYRQADNGQLFALPRVPGFCATSVSDAGGNPLLRLARAGWHAIRDGLASLLTPRPLFARSTAVVLDVGGGGQSDFTSRFRFVLPAQMDPVDFPEGQTAQVGSTVQNPPAVYVSDFDGNPVAGATVTFEVTSGGGTLGTGSTFTAMSGTNGKASVPSWALGPALAANKVKASARAIAGPTMPNPTLPPSGPTSVPAGPGTVDFEAFAFQDAATATVDVNHYLLNLSPGFYTDATFHSTDILFSGGLSYGNSSTAVLIYNTSTGASDFGGPNIRVFRPGPLAAHQTRTVMSESPQASPPGKTGLGLSIVRETFAFSTAADLDYVIVKYTIHNPGAAMVSGVHIGEIIDADVGPPVAPAQEPTQGEIDDDFGEYVSALEMARVTSTGDPQLGFILLTDQVTSYRSWRNPSAPATGLFEMDPQDPSTNAGWFSFLSGGIVGPDSPFGPTDVRHLLSHGPVSIGAGESRVVAVALLGGSTAADLAASVAAARAKWLTLPSGPTPVP